MFKSITKNQLFSQALILFSLFYLLALPCYGAVVFETNFDSNADWNATGQNDGLECSPLGVGSPATCASSAYPENWSGFRSVPGAGGLNPVVSIDTPPYGGDHTTGAGKTAVIRQESVSGVNWPGDGLILKYLGSEYNELYVQFWVKSQSGWQMPATDNYFKFFRIQRKGNLATNWFDEFTQGIRPSPGMLVQPKRSTYGWRHMDPFRGYPDDNGTNFRGVCRDTSVWNGRTVCNYGAEGIEDPYEYSNPSNSPSDVGQLFDGSWHRVVYRIKMNTVGTDDGILQMWIDGVQKTNATKLRWQASGTPVGFNLVVFGGNGNNTFSSSAADQWYAFDDIVVSTTAIPADYVIGGGSTVVDTTAPAASISSPANSATVSGTVSVNANASDNVGVTKVEYYVNSALKATDTSSPYVYSWDTSALAAGSYALLTKAYDAAGNVGQSGIINVSIVKDTTIPTVSLTAPANNVTVSGSVTMTASAADNVGISRVEFYSNGTLLTASNVAPYSYNWNTTSVANGPCALTVKAYDASSNVAQSATVSVTVNNQVADTTLPTVSITSPAANSTVSGTVLIAASVADNVGVSKVEFYVNGALKATDATAPYAFSWDSKSVVNGDYTLTTKAYDAAGNVGQSSAVSVTVNNTATDTAAPVTSITSPVANATVSGTVSIAATASDNVGVSKVEYYVNGALKATSTAAPYSYSWDSKSVVNGAYTLTTRAYDAVGNVGSSSAVNVSVNNSGSDTIAPTVSITAPVANSSVRGTINISATANDNVGVTKVELYVNGVLSSINTTSNPYYYAWNTAGLANGAYTLTTRAYDAAGNVGQSSAVTVTVNNAVADTTAPATSITFPAANATVSGTVSIAAAASDNVAVSKVECYVNGALKATSTAAPYSYSWDSKSVANGAYTLTTRAYDAAGNVGQSSAVAVTVNNIVTVADIIVPAISITSPSANATVRRTISITAAASDNVGVSRVEYYVNGILKATDTAAPYAYSWNTKAVANGLYSITTKAYDAAGNVKQSAAVNVTVKNYFW